MLEDRVTKMLKCQLNETELRERGDIAGDLVQRINRLKQEKKNQASATQEVIDRHGAKLNDVAEELREKATHRDVECEIHFDRTSNEVYVIREDTGEEIERRLMTDAERQRPLPLGEVADEAGPLSDDPDPVLVDISLSVPTDGDLLTESEVENLGVPNAVDELTP